MHAKNGVSHDNINGLTIIHWTDKPLRSTAGSVAIFNGANYSYETDTCVEFCEWKHPRYTVSISVINYVGHSYGVCNVENVSH